MVRRQSAATRGVGSKPRRALEPGCETLENRTVLSASRSLQALLQTAGHPGPAHHPAVIGTISGQVTNELNGKGVAHIRVQLIGVDLIRGQSIDETREHAREAHEALRGLIEGKRVWLEFDEIRRAPDGRTVLYYDQRAAKIRRVDVATGRAADVLDVASQGVFAAPDRLLFVRGGDLVARL